MPTDCTYEYGCDYGRHYTLTEKVDYPKGCRIQAVHTAYHLHPTYALGQNLTLVALETAQLFRQDKTKTDGFARFALLSLGIAVKENCRHELTFPAAQSCNAAISS